MDRVWRPPLLVVGVVLALLALAVLVRWVLTPALDNGTVVELRHEPENEWFYMQPIPHTICSGSPPRCTTTYTYVPIWMHDDEDWVVVIGDGKRTSDKEVDAETFARYRVGDAYP